MGNWTLKGDLGAGKSKLATIRTFQYLAEGKKVASNMNFFLENYFPPSSRLTYIRLPDFPTAEQLWSLGYASDSKREETFGYIVLDELAVYLNSREWQGKQRDMVIKYLRHVRKQHWHTIFITQDIESIDAQARRALIEHTVTCKRTDRFSIPLIGWLLRIIGLAGRLPKIHLGIVRYGKSDTSAHVDTWKHRGNSRIDISYDTDQKFTDDNSLVLTGSLGEFEATADGIYSVLSPWHLKGRYLTPYERIKPYLQNTLYWSLCVLFLYFIFIGVFKHPYRSSPIYDLAKNKPHFFIPDSPTLLAHGKVYRSDTDSYIFTDKQVVTVSLISQDDKFFYYFANGTWYSQKKAD